MTLKWWLYVIRSNQIKSFNSDNTIMYIRTTTIESFVEICNSLVYENFVKTIKRDSRTTWRLMVTVAVPKPFVASHVYRPESVASTLVMYNHAPARCTRNLCQPRWTMSESLVHDTSGRGSPWTGHEMRTVEPSWTTSVAGYWAFTCGGCDPGQNIRPIWHMQLLSHGHSSHSNKTASIN